MKRLILSVLVAMLGLTGITQSGNAQFVLGGGASYGTGLEQAGLNLSGEFFFRPQVSFILTTSYFFENETKLAKENWWEYNFNMNIYVTSEDFLFQTYGLTGLSVLNRYVNRKGLSNFRDWAYGWNIGLGVGVGPQRFVGFLEGKYVVSEAPDQFVFTGGVKIRFGFY